MSNYRRYYINGGTWFFTVNLKNRKSDLLVRQIAELRSAIRRVKNTKPFQIDAFCLSICIASGRFLRTIVTFHLAGGSLKSYLPNR